MRFFVFYVMVHCHGQVDYLWGRFRTKIQLREGGGQIRLLTQERDNKAKKKIQNRKTKRGVLNLGKCHETINNYYSLFGRFMVLYGMIIKRTRLF